MRVLLINPPRFNEIVADNPSFIDEERGFNPPLGLLYLAGYLKKNSSHSVFGIDAQAERLNYDNRFVNRIVQTAPDVVGITAMTFTLIDVVKTIEIVRGAEKFLKKKIAVVLGGPHAHLFPEETIKLEGVDYVIKGEGEISFYNLLETLEGRGRLDSIRGLVYLNSGRVVNNPVSDFVERLDDLPFPDRDLLPVENYSSILGSERVVTTMFTSRGCPFQCTFCDRPHLGKKFRARGARNVVDEMEVCLKKGIEAILVYDDTFTVDRQRVLDVCREINRRKLKFVWDIRARVDTVDGEMLVSLKRAGCQRIHFGVEAGTDKILKVLNKGIDLTQAENVFRFARKIGIETLAYFMIGSPTETREDIRQTMSFAKKIKPDYAHITILTPYPGTHLYNKALREGVIACDYWRGFAASPLQGVTTRYWEKELTRRELFDSLGKFYKDFYGRPSYILKKALQVRSFDDLRKKVKVGLKILNFKKMESSLWQGVKDFLGFPLRIALDQDTIKKFGLTSFQDERFNVCLKHARGKILDIGCGEGNEFIKRAGHGVGLDFYPWLDADVVASAEKTPFGAKEFDTITMMVSLRYMQNKDQVLQEARRILKDDGIVLILENAPWINYLRRASSDYWNPYKDVEEKMTGNIVGFTKKGMRNLLGRNGFRLRKIVPYVYGLSRMYVVTK